MEVRKIHRGEAALLEQIAQWMYDWWGAEAHRTLEEIRLFTESSAQDDALPQTYGLFVDETLVGIWQLRLDDLFVRPDIYPWLANVYVAPAYRGKGYGRALNESVRQLARENLNCNELYLYTHHTGLYEKYGWQYLGPIDTVTGQPRIQRFYRLSLR